MGLPRIFVVPSPGNTDLFEETLAELQKLSPRYVRCSVVTKFFADNEPHVEIKDHVGGESVVVIACVCNDDRRSVNDNWMLVISLLDALSRAGAKFRTALFPYFPYGRQDRRAGQYTHRTSVTAALVPQMLHVASYKLRHVCAVETHARMDMAFQRGLFYDTVPVLRGFVEPLRRHFPNMDEVVVVSPDKGGVERASNLAYFLGNTNPIAQVDKRRLAPGKAEAVQVVGQVKDCDVILVDDIIDTFGSLVEASQRLRDAGARRIIACAVHGLFNGPALERLQRADQIERVLVTSTVWLRPEVRACPKIEVVRIGHLLAEAIDRLLTRQSIQDTGKAPYKVRPAPKRPIIGHNQCP